MNNMITRLRAAASLMNEKAKQEFTTTINLLEHELKMLVRADSANEAETRLQAVNGLWARSKQEHIRLLKRPLVTLRRQ